jgi:2-dehydropantoate 2-reductase
MSRYVIVGAGAIGGALGGMLTRAGREAVLVARGEHAAALSGQGLRLRTPDEDVLLAVRAATEPGEVRLDVDDVLVMATKCHQVEAALTQWVDAPVHRDGRVVGTAGELLPVCTALNGVAAEERAARYFRTVVGVCVWVPAVHLVPGEVLLRAARPSGVFHIGRYPRASGADGEAGLLARIRADWTGAGFQVLAHDDVMRWKYRKLVDNLANCVQAMLGPHEDRAPIVAAARAEARAVLDRVGVGVTSDEEEAAVRAGGFAAVPVPGEPSELGGSSWQSLARGTGNIESDYLNGEIALIARRHGFDAPVNATLATLARAAAAAGRRPGEVGAEMVRAALARWLSPPVAPPRPA